MKNKILKDKELLDLFHKREMLESELSDIERQIEKKEDKLNIQIGYEVCEDVKNPYNVCMYKMSDSSMDNCIFCHQPDERK